MRREPSFAYLAILLFSVSAPSRRGHSAVAGPSTEALAAATTARVTSQDAGTSSRATAHNAAAPSDSSKRRDGAGSIVRTTGETPEHLSVRVLPKGAQTIATPLEFEFQPLGKIVLVLYQMGRDDPRDENDPSVYRGRVLVPSGTPKTYRIEELPSMKEGAGTLMYENKSVFAADADGDGLPELCVLSEITEVGTAGRSYTDTDIFKWSGTKFRLVKQGDNRPLYNLRTAKAVRAQLKKGKLRPR